jgi:hypothetical protein
MKKMTLREIELKNSIEHFHNLTSQHGFDSCKVGALFKTFYYSYISPSLIFVEIFWYMDGTGTMNRSGLGNCFGLFLFFVYI